MVRIIIDRLFEGGLHYIKAAGLADDTKPSGVITGSEYIAVDTGDKYAYDEEGDDWNKTGSVGVSPEEIAAAVDAWLDAHPEATTTVEDGAITEAKLDNNLKGVVSDVGDLKTAFDDITENTKNMFDPQYLVTPGGWQESNGEFYGTINKIQGVFKPTNLYPMPTFEANTRYVISMLAYTDGDNTTSGNGLALYFKYTDDSTSYNQLSNSTSQYTRLTIVSSANKTVAGIYWSYGSGGLNTWHIKEIQCEKGITPTAYMPFVTAIDAIARQNISDMGVEVSLVDKYIKTITATYDFSNATLNSTYVARWNRYNIPVGASVDIEVSAPSGDTNYTYFILEDAQGNRLTSTGLAYGYGSRRVTITNSYSVAVARVGFVAQKILQQNVYTMTFFDAANLVKQVSALDSIVGGSAVPVHFVEQLNAAISSAQANMAGAGINGESFVFISDIHWAANSHKSPALVHEITRRLPIENTIFGGDAINGGTQAASLADFNAIRTNFTWASPRFLSVIGNHDYNTLDGGVAFTNNEYYTFLQKQSDYYVDYVAPYYFKMDNPTTKTRFIFLDTGAGSSPSNAEAQLAWLQSVLSDTDNGWHIIVIAHIIYLPGAGGSYSDPTTWELTTFMQSVLPLLDAVNTGGGKKVEAIFGGHLHYDYDSATTGGIPIVLIDCDARQTQTGNTQTAGTVGEQAFDIVTVDYSGETVYCVRVGRGSNRTISY